MAFNVSPGVYWKEIDLSNYIPQLSSTQMGIVGLATKGPINNRELITDGNQLVKTFGYPTTTGYYGIDAALQYLKQGNQLWFVRVESENSPAAVATATIDYIGDPASPVGNLESKDPGTFYNNLRVVIAPSVLRRIVFTLGTGDGSTKVFDDTLPNTVINTLEGGTTQAPITKSTVKIYTKATGAQTWTLAGEDNGLGVIAGTPLSGTNTIDYDTGEITVTFTSAPAVGTLVKCECTYASAFNLTIEKTVENKTYQLEIHKSLSLDPKADRYYSSVLASSWILAVPTLALFPASQTVTLTGGTDGDENIDDADFIGTIIGNDKTGLQLFNGPEEVDINAIAIPGKNTDALVQALIALAEDRRDCVAIIDPPYGLSPEAVVDWADGKNEYSDRNAINSSYAALYYPWVKIYDTYNDADKFIPGSGFVGAAFALTDRIADVWYAPAGWSRGKLTGVIGTERPLTQGERDFLYEHRVNPINDFAASGIMIWGQRTTQVYPTALDRINVRRLLIYLEKIIVTAAQPLVFEPHIKRTWVRLVDMVQPYLDFMVAKGALYYGKIVCDAVTNPPEKIDQNEMVANIFLKPVKTAEIITLNFVILSTGAIVEEYLGQQF